MKRAQRSLSSSPKQAESLEDSLKKVGVVVLVRLKITRKMIQHSFSQLTENRFTDLLPLRMLSMLDQIGALALEDAH